MGLQNGMYIARASGTTDYTLILRVDIDPLNARAGYVSGDIYEGYLYDTDILDTDEMSSEIRFLLSFRSTELSPNNPPNNPPQLEVSLFGLEGMRDRIDLTIQSTGLGDSLSIKYVGTSTGSIPGGDLQFISSGRRQAEFHDLHIEIDSSPGIPTPTTVTVTRGGNAYTMADCFRRAGFRMLTGVGNSSLPQETDDTGYTLSQLVGFYEAIPSGPQALGFFNRQKGLSLSVYQMIVSRFKGNPRITGAMFQQSKRAWCSVFYGSLQDQFGRPESAIDELNANYLFTAIHEISHCLNLPHAFESAAAAYGINSNYATFMNYPQIYAGPDDTPYPDNYVGALNWDSTQLDNYRRFWSRFRYAFVPQELLLLRHCDRRDLLVPGSGNDQNDVAGNYRGEFAANMSAMAFGGRDGAGLQLLLRVRSSQRFGDPGEPGQSADSNDSPPVFEFGEPVVVEARLKSLINRPRQIDRPLSVMTGDLQVSYRSPDGRYFNFVPPAALCSIGEGKIIDGNVQTPEPEAFYKNICLTAANEANGIWEPGRYLIRAAYRHGDTQLVSNVLELFVRYPNRATEDLLIPLICEDVNKYFSFRGVVGIAGAEKRLQAAFLTNSGRLRNIKHPLLNYYAGCEARLRAEGAMKFDSKTGWSPAYPAEDSLDWYRRSLGIANQEKMSLLEKGVSTGISNLPFSNITLAKIGTSFHDQLVKHGEPTEAQGLAVHLDEALKKRGVPQKVRVRYLPQPVLT